MSRPVDVGSVKVGMTIIVEGEPSRIVEYEKSKPGKHGSAKARIMAIGLFDGVKRSLLSPVDGKVDIPVIDKRTAQVLSLTPSTVQLMDMETYEVFEVPLPTDEEIKAKLAPPLEIEYWRTLGRNKIVRVRG